MKKALFIFIILLLVSIQAHSQFNDQGMNNQTNTSNTSDSTYKKEPPAFSFKKYFRALGHKDTIPVAQVWAGSLILPGTAQIYNKDYWKLPVLYGGVGAMIYGGWHNNMKYKETNNIRYANQRDWFYVGAAFVYWASLLDGVVSYDTKIKTLPGKATIYSALLPGLGLAYIGDYWRIPIYYTGFAITGYLWYYNNAKYVHYKDLYNQASNPNANYDGPISKTNLKYYRDSYRRYRDYSIVATILIYSLQIIDANVFATLSDFDISDDITVDISPAIINPITTNNKYNYTSTLPTSYGIQIGFRF